MEDRYRVRPGDIRIGDAERDEVTGKLHEHYALGRLDASELDERLNAALAAKTVGELQRITVDLPGHAGATDAKLAKRMERLEKSAQKDAAKAAKHQRRQGAHGHLSRRHGGGWVGPVGIIVLVFAAIGAVKVLASVTPLIIVALVVWFIITRSSRT